MTYAIQISRDDGKTWHTIAVNRPDPEIQIDRSQFRQGERLLLKVITTDGVTGRETVSPPFPVGTF